MTVPCSSGQQKVQHLVAFSITFSLIPLLINNHSTTAILAITVSIITLISPPHPAILKQRTHLEAPRYKGDDGEGKKQEGLGAVAELPQTQVHRMMGKKWIELYYSPTNTTTTT